MTGYEKPQLILKPRIIAGILPKFISSILFVFIFLGYFTLSFLRSATFLGSFLSIIIMVIVFVAIPLVTLFLAYMNLRSRQYRFFNDRVEFYEGFLNIQRRVVRYDRVTDVSSRKSVWERIWSTGTVMLNTAGSPFREVRISYVRNPDKVYNDVQNVIRKYSGTSATGYQQRRPPARGGGYQGSGQRGAYTSGRY